ncbi:hypothetical protein HK100_005469, partial [Physocladia obscura]
MFGRQVEPSDSEPNSPRTDLQPPQYPRPSDHEPKGGSNLLSPIDPASKRVKSAALISSYFQSSSNTTEPSTLTNPPRNLTAPVYVVPAHQSLLNRNGHGGKRSVSGRKPKRTDPFEIVTQNSTSNS